ncbi:unnamed protein product [Chrysodeixis includens]|uniref:ascorbate ferrireductase (transmembrane) n=1 Tax=Chrysodeixis includens TaxID=689277 RepID=A0A9P0FUG8_CHRIL|nr:unnamed protein product [Chrysodeixis includens]
MAFQKQTHTYPTMVHVVENGGQVNQNPPIATAPIEIPNNQNQMFLVTMNIINSLTHMFLGSVVISALIYANFASGKFTQHIYLCVFGYVILMAQAILTFNPHNGWSSNLQYPVKRKIHSLMQIAGSLLAICGCSIQISNVWLHWRSTHAIFGMIAFFLTLISLLGGVYHLIYPTHMKGSLKKMHAVAGCLTITAAFLALAFGFHHMRRMIVFGDTNTNLFIATTILALAGTLAMACSRVLFRGRV